MASPTNFPLHIKLLPYHSIFVFFLIFIFENFVFISGVCNKEWDDITLGMTIGIFTPIIDGSFLEDKPEVLLKKEMFKKTNILMGANKDEGFFNIFYYLSDMFQKQEEVFINREEFERSILELNIDANPLQRK